MKVCYWPLTRCPDCGESYCEKCDPHICETEPEEVLEDASPAEELAKQS